MGLDPDVTSRFTLPEVERRWALDRRFYRTGQFADQASVSLRTLRYYDRLGLLSPAEHTEAGYRLYTEAELVRLQQILALKFLGFSLDEIKACLHAGPQRLSEVLARQKAMMREKRSQIEAVIAAIDETEELLESGQDSWEAVARVIQAIQMEQKKDWVKKYFTDEQLQRMVQLGRDSYSDEARQTLAQRMAESEWTEGDQEQASAQWAHVASEARRLAAAGADPGGPEVQAVAKLKHDLLSAFTRNDPEVQAGLSRFWEQFNALPPEQKPFNPTPFDAGPDGTELLNKAMAIYQERQAGSGKSEESS